MIWLSVQPWKKYDTDPNVSYVLAGRAGAWWSTLQRGSVREGGEERESEGWKRGEEVKGMEEETEEEQQREMD